MLQGDTIPLWGKAFFTGVISSCSKSLGGAEVKASAEKQYMSVKFSSTWGCRQLARGTQQPLISFLRSSEVQISNSLAPGAGVAAQVGESSGELTSTQVCKASVRTDMVLPGVYQPGRDRYG